MVAEQTMGWKAGFYNLRWFWYVEYILGNPAEVEYLQQLLRNVFLNALQ